MTEPTKESLINISKGMLDCHLGRIFTHDEVFPTKLQHKISYWRKKLWWKVIIPYQRIKHFNCKTCRKYREMIQLSGSAGRVEN